MAEFVPDAGDMVWLQFSPQLGHEQAGHRPALCVSPYSYNQASGLMVCCPMTTQVKDYPFEVTVSGKKSGVVLADQVKSMDWRARGAKRFQRVGEDELAEVKAKIHALLFSD